MANGDFLAGVATGFSKEFTRRQAQKFELSLLSQKIEARAKIQEEQASQQQAQFEARLEASATRQQLELESLERRQEQRDENLIERLQLRATLKSQQEKEKALRVVRAFLLNAKANSPETLKPGIEFTLAVASGGVLTPEEILSEAKSQNIEFREITKEPTKGTLETLFTPIPSLQKAAEESGVGLGALSPVAAATAGIRAGQRLITGEEPTGLTPELATAALQPTSVADLALGAGSFKFGSGILSRIAKSLGLARTAGKGAPVARGAQKLLTGPAVRGRVPSPVGPTIQAGGPSQKLLGFNVPPLATPTTRALPAPAGRNLLEFTRRGARGTIKAGPRKIGSVKEAKKILNQARKEASRTGSNISEVLPPEELDQLLNLLGGR